MPDGASMKTGCAVLLALHITLGGAAPLLAADSENQGQKSETSVEVEQETIPTYPVGLDKKSLQLINQGKWKEVAARLEKLTAAKKDNSYSRNNVWLAFAYMFLNRKKDLAALNERLRQPEDSDEHGKTFVKVVEAFQKISAGDSKEAAEILKTLPRKHSRDALINFALAAVSGKNGKAEAAIEYCKRSVEIDPQFAWGFRTLGYLQLRWLSRGEEAEISFLKALAIEPRQEEVRSMLVRSMLGHNDYDGAIQIARDAIFLDKKEPENHLRLATIYQRQWRFNEAVDELNQAIKLDSENANYFRRRGQIRQYQGEYEEAIKDQSKAVALSKDKSFELVALARMNNAAGNKDAAIANLKEALERNPKNGEAHRELANLLTFDKRYDELVEEYRRVLKDQEKNADLHFLLAEALMAAGKEKEGVEEYTNAANLNPQDPKALRKLGTYYSEKKSYDKAIKAFRKALNINPTSVADMVALGYCFAQDDNYLQSEAAFVTALALKQLNQQSNLEPPSRQDIVRTLASLLLLEGRYGEARNQFQSLFSMTRQTAAKNIDAFLLAQSEALASPVPSNLDKLEKAYGEMSDREKRDYRYSYIQTLIKVGKVEDSLAALSKLEAKDFEKEPKWNILKARAYRENKQLEEAEKVVDDSILKSKDREESEPSLVADALVEKARIKMDQGKDDEAEQSATEALSTYPKSYASYLVLGKLKYKKGAYADVVPLLKKALEQNPYYTEAYLLSGDACFKAGDAREALAYYKDAYKVRPEMPAVHKALLKAYKELSMDKEIAEETEQLANMEKLK